MCEKFHSSFAGFSEGWMEGKEGILGAAKTVGESIFIPKGTLFYCYKTWFF